jgi:hypothetical protein
MYPEDPSEWTVDDFAPQRKIREPPYEVWNAAQAVFKALAACRGCICHPVHEFGARLCLSTYRKPYVGTDVGIDDDMFDFDMFISMMQEWHETCVHTAKEAVVQFTIDDDISQTQPKKKGPVNKPMKVKRLCEPIAKIKTMTSYRLELKVTKGQLFKLQSQRSKSLFDITKDSISLKQILEGKSRSFTEKTRRILAVILSSAVLHLVDTPWLQPVWSSTNVLFLRTASEAIPLRPFIQIPLSNGERGNCIEHQSGSEDIPSNERAQLPDYNSDDIDPDDIDPDDLVGHQCLIVISLAVMLMEVYFATPFHDLASRFGIELGEDAEFRSCTRYLDTTLVFEACRGEIPENFQFLYAIEKCLDPTIWEDAGGNRLDSQTLRTRIYEEVVRPLETELSQAYSSISIDDLDRFALGLDLASWDRTIQPWIQQPHAETPRGHAQDFSRTSSPSSQLTSSYHSQNYLPLHSRLQQLDPFELGHQPVPSSHFDHPYNILPKLAHVATGESDNKSLKFFDDETISEAHSYQA